MKNFTNNFKQFTSRLSARWLIMALMLLVGIGELFAATTVYFVNKPKWTQVNVHQWNGGTGSSWPGPQATKENYQVNGYDVYQASIGDNKNFVFSNNGGNQTADLDISNGTWYYDGKQYSSKEAIEGAINNSHSTHTSITKFPVSGSDVIYFDATGTDWTTCYMYIGHNDYSKRFAMTRVAGTKNLWKGTSFGSWNDAQAWYFSSEDWNEIANGKHECILCKACYHTENTFLMPYKSDFTNNAIYKASANNQMYATSECYKNAWSWSDTETTYTTYTVTIKSVTGGTLTVKDYDDNTVSSGASKSILTVLEFSASASTGYTFKEVQISNGSSTTKISAANLTSQTYTITSDVTITPVWTANQYTITYKDKGNADFSGTHAGGYPTKHTYGTATTLDSPTKTGYTFGGWFTDSNCTGTKVTSLGATAYTENITLYAKWELACAVPEQPTVQVINHTTKCNTITKGKVKITNYQSDCEYYMGDNTSPLTVSVVDGNAYIYFELTSSNSYTIRAKRVCGSTKSEYSARSASFTVNYTDKTPTITRDVTISGPTQVCPGGEITLIANVSTESTVSSYSWSPNVGNTQSVTVSPTENTDYSVTVTVTNDVCSKDFSTTTPHAVTIENPTASIEGDACVKSTGTTYSHTGSIFTAYEWEADPMASMTITGENTATPTVKFNTGYNTGTLKFRGTTAAGCQSDWATKTLNAEPTVSPSQSAGAICDGETLKLQLSYTNATSFQWFKDRVEIPGQTGNTLIVSTPGTYYAKVFNDLGCSAQTEDIVISDKFGSNVTPSIDGPASTQTGATATYTASNISGATYSWTLPKGWSITSGEGTNTITVSIPTTEGNGTVSVAVINNGCTKSATKEVQWMNGFTVYLRRPHATNEKTQYNYWFEKSGTASPGYVKFGTVNTNPTGTEMYGYNGGTSATTKDPNEVAVKGTEAFTDCDGYVWDAYNIGIDVTALYFRAPNDKATNNTFYGGYATYTLSYTQNTPIAENMYFTMGDWTSSKQYGRALNKVDAPFSGITIAALGSTEICSNNEASFAALYLKTNCTRKEILSYQWKYSTDNAKWSDYEPVECTYRVEDETAEYKDEQIKSSLTNNIRPTEAGWYRLECMLEDSPTPVVSDAIEITTKTCDISDATLYTFKSSLPIIMVNTGGEGFPSCENNNDFPSQHVDAMKKKRSVDVKIKMPDGSIYYDRKARMNYRGSSSLNFEKKSFAFCPGKANCGDKEKSADYVKTTKMNLFGLSNNALDKDWVLYAAYPDPSMIRNVLNMEVYAAMTGKWGCTNQHVELYIDGEYRGVYVFMDKITKNKKRVDVKWEVKNGENVKKGFILKFDKTDIQDRIENSEGDQKTFASSLTGSSGDGINSYDAYFDQRFEIEYPEKEDIQDDGGSWSSVVDFIKGKVEAFENALMSDNFTEVRKHIDYETWADYFIINEYSKNEDAYRASCVFVYNETTDKLEAWPLWDYELSMDNSVAGQGKGGGDKTGLIINNAAMYSDGFKAPFWWTGQYNGSNACAGLLNDPCFAQMIKSRWDDHIADNGELNPKKITARVSKYETLLKGAYDRESTRWPYNKRGKAQCNEENTGYYQYGGGGSNTNYTGSLNELKAWIAKDGRLPELTKEINKLVADIEFSLTVTGDKDTTTPWRPVNVTVNAVGADFTYEVTPAMAEGQVVEGTGNLLVYPGYSNDLPKDYTVTVTLDAKDQCGASGENIKETVTFTVQNLEANCEE